jgi:hypothetical protein
VAATPSPGPRETSERHRGLGRAKYLVVAGLLLGLCCGALALLTGGPTRIQWAAAAFVFVAASGYGAFELWLQNSGTSPLELEAPAEVTPLPQSPVTQLHDPHQQVPSSPEHIDGP